MRPLHAFRYLVAICLVSLAGGCKLATIVVQGGEVQSIASGTCLAGSVCLHEIPDTSYAETFTAVPDPGWAFVKWNSGGNFFCAKSTNPVCELSLAGAAGNGAIEALVASDETFYIMPIFTEVTGAPITDTVIVDGKEWAQVKLFLFLSWNEINAQCPNGVCTVGSTLKGFDMSGWHWAGPAEVAALFNYYLSNAGVSGNDLIDPSDLNDFYEAWGETWLTAFTADFHYYDLQPDSSFYIQGWAANSTGQRYTMARQDDPTNPPYTYYTYARSSSYWSSQPDYHDLGTGGWFYRPL